MALPNFLQPYLASYDLSKLNKDNSSVRKEVITQVLNSGDDKAIRWLFGTYSQKTIKNILHKPKRGAWFKDSLSYWQRILGIKIPFSLVQKAIFDLNR
ncbi:hypothetical protein COU96_02970 [Candidatus Shapirobacteria bacterium CG10_big_fil_rev_8_21_14_0_10_38_14]|uniref:DUF6922 domain-containing protein n=1 Tax=Candidatus Shapirobacteria bacterium CG10_big_fil_rev_8_21_14_0_10_38_14 TaxID=1974483 RepID=A0A2M8L4S8_9BACT|nr:MAG: hypothetical protein COU96_02970 [Candidatus Shapirobacteria bacterium CG10_big_fil_rev_8_21_14_0_10_38_14]